MLEGSKADLEFFAWQSPYLNINPPPPFNMKYSHNEVYCSMLRVFDIRRAGGINIGGKGLELVMPPHSKGNDLACRSHPVP